MLSIIVAVSENNVIGKDNKLLWHIPEDLKRFKKLTTGKTIIMGRKTFESLGKLLPERKHIVLSRDPNHELLENKEITIVEDISKLTEYINSEEEVFIIGGAIIYRLLMPYVNKMYVTRIHKIFEGDAFFPVIKEEEWVEKEKIKGLNDEKNPYNYDFITYIKK